MILSAIAMVAVVLTAAIVVDLASTRAVRGNARAAADAAVTAGALDLAADSKMACRTAFAYAFANLGGAQPTADDTNTIQQKCDDAATGMGWSACPAQARVVAHSVRKRIVTVTSPVLDTDPLLRAKAVGTEVDQPAAAAADGTACARMGVEITQPQSRFFSGVASSASGDFSIRSVARHQPPVSVTEIPPALIVLNRNTCKAINTGSGKILVEATSAGPGTVFADSDGTNPLCTGGDGILHVSGAGAVRAAASASSPGLLAWYSAPTSRGYVNSLTPAPLQDATGTTSSNYPYVGKLYSRSTRTTRAPADKKYHCTTIPVTAQAPLCTIADPLADPVKDADALAQGTTAPYGYTTWTPPAGPGPAMCGTAAGPLTFTGKVYVDCSPFTVKDNPLIVTGGATIVFKGRLHVESNGVLAVNVTSPTAPSVDGAGLPVAATPTAQTQLIVRSTESNAIDISSNSAAVYMAQTFVYSRGGFDQQALDKLRWSPPSTGSMKGLLYWSEAAQPLAIQGGPVLKAAGVMFQGNGTLKGGGGGTIDLTNVQMWVDKVELGGSTTVKLRPDPANSIKVPGETRPGSSLIR